MRFTPKIWAVLSMLLFLAAAFCWKKGNEYQTRQRQLLQPTPASPQSSLAPKGAARPLQLLTTAGSLAATPAPIQAPNAFPYRLANTTTSLGQLARRDHAILLRNALFDTAVSRRPEIPAHLRSEGDPGSYIVQSKQAIDQNFRTALQEVGAKVVSYIPNNAFLVQATPVAAAALEASPWVQTVIPFEPYFKLDPRLLKGAVAQTPLPPEVWLRVTVFEGQVQAAEQGMAQMGTEIIGITRSPFGPQLTVRPRPDSVPQLARLSAVQMIEPQKPRILANDLARVFVGAATNLGAATNYLELNGTNIWVNLNDIAVDKTHPDLTGRVFSYNTASNRPPFVDVDGHGTFVAATLVGSGKGALSTNTILGSATNSTYQGMAPASKLFVLPINLSPAVNSASEDIWLQETAASTNFVTFGRTNTLLSNNSWLYEGAFEYDSAAASFDSAVRDALPTLTGPQAVLYLFPSGNFGQGNDSGSEGEPGLIASPATAKNVITIGALEQARFLTNTITLTNIVVDPETGENVQTNVDTNFVFQAASDSAYEVASYSSRGNVGYGTEGDFGRFKPDLVAPGSFLVSARSKPWKLEDHVSTNSDIYLLLKDLNDPLGPDYRVDSGTSFAVPHVTGILALVQQFFEQRLPKALKRTLSPALMKALVINGARSVSEQYDRSPRATINYQGWGGPSLQRMVTASMINLTEKEWPIQLVEQSPTNALATGESRSWKVKLSKEASQSPWNVTVVWTDPPGNPGASLKLVNDLDLEVRNDGTGVLFIGNDIGVDSTFNGPHPAGDAALPELRDFVNNVENVFIKEPFKFETNTTWTITVRARRVNVNAISDYFEKNTSSVGTRAYRTNDVVQDFALVFASDNLALTNAFQVTSELANSVADVHQAAAVSDGFSLPVVMTNGLPLFNQLVSANPSLITTNGVTNQWRFYVFDNKKVTNEFNSLTNGSNVVFAIFNPPNLSASRVVDADLDMYVSRDVGLLSLEPKVMAHTNTFVSLGRQGEELAVFTNGLPTDIFYVAIKSEDQMAGEFSLLGLSTDEALEKEGPGGSRLLTGLPINVIVPDGTPGRPKAGIIIAVGLSTSRIMRTTVDATFNHQLLGDLVGNLKHGSQSVILNNHTLNNGNFQGRVNLVYNDSSLTSGMTNSITTDGPGSLNNFVGQRMSGAWLLTEIDNANGHTGRVETMTIRIDPMNDPLKNGITVFGSVDAGGIDCYPIEVPVEATNMIVRLKQKTPGIDLGMWVRRDELPTADVYDAKGTNIVVGAQELQLGERSTPPLIPGGNYFLCITNANTFVVDYEVTVLFEIGTAGANRLSFTSYGGLLSDDAVTKFSVFADVDKTVAGARVSLRIDHSRVSDLSVHLVSPQGTRVVLTENRGGANTLGYGSTLTLTNSLGAITNQQAFMVFTEEEDLADLPIKFKKPPFADYGTNRGEVFLSTFETATNANYQLGESVEGWVVDSNLVSVLSNDLRAYSGTNLLILRQGAVHKPSGTKQGRAYQMTFAYRRASFLNLLSTGLGDDKRPLATNALDPHYFVVESADALNPAPLRLVVGDPLLAPINRWFPNDLNSQWIAPNPPNAGNAHPPGKYVYRTVFESPTVSPYKVTGRWASENAGQEILINGVSFGLSSSNQGPAAFSQQFVIDTNFVSGLNTLDFVVTNLNSGSNQPIAFRAEMASSAALEKITNGWLQVKLNSTWTNLYLGGDDWKVASIEFVATADDQDFSLICPDGSVWIDEIRLVDTGTIYALPEEPLASLKSQRLIGEWTLEILDHRTQSALGDVPSLIEWRLDLDLAPPLPPAERLGNNVNYPNTINVASLTNGPLAIIPGVLHGDEIQYFIVPSCPSGQKVQITLLGLMNYAAIQLLADRSGLPTGNPLTDDYAPILNDLLPASANGLGVLTISTSEPEAAPLNPFQPMFLAVRNIDRFSTNSFQLKVVSDGNCVVPQPAPIVNNNPIRDVAASSDFDVSQNFVFYVPSDSTTAQVVMASEPSSGLAVQLRKGDIPSATIYDYITDPSSETPQIHIHSTTQPVPLAPGAWFISVINRSSKPGQFSLAVDYDGSAGSLIESIVNNRSLASTLPVSSTNLYSTVVDSTLNRLLVEVGDFVGPILLTATRSEDGWTQSVSNGRLLIRPDATHPSLTGHWTVAIANHGTVTTPITLQVSTAGVGSILPSLNRIKASLDLDSEMLSWTTIPFEFYQIESTADLENWQVVSGSLHQSAGEEASHKMSLSGSGDTRFFRVVQVTGP